MKEKRSNIERHEIELSPRDLVLRAEDVCTTGIESFQDDTIKRYDKSLERLRVSNAIEYDPELHEKFRNEWRRRKRNATIKKILTN